MSLIIEGPPSPVGFLQALTAGRFGTTGRPYIPSWIYSSLSIFLTTVFFALLLNSGVAQDLLLAGPLLLTLCVLSISNFIYYQSFSHHFHADHFYPKPSPDPQRQLKSDPFAWQGLQCNTHLGHQTHCSLLYSQPQCSSQTLGNRPTSSLYPSFSTTFTSSEATSHANSIS